MNRRTFSQLSLTGAAGMLFPFSASTGADALHLLSSNGCGRATGYAEANKIVRTGERHHFSWLDSTAKGFAVRVRSYDHSSGSWSSTYTVGEGFDNHGGPALVADSQGYLHIVYYPHHREMRYRKSRRPYDTSEWEDEISFGAQLTYPTMLCAADDTLLLSTRMQLSNSPWQVVLWRKEPGGAWEGPHPILKARYPGYSHFQESLAWGPDGKRLHLCCRIHEKTDSGAYGRIQTVGYLYSDDQGMTWHRSDGNLVKLPASAAEIERIAEGGLDRGIVLRAGAMGVDPMGNPHLVYSREASQQGRSFWQRLSAKGKWISQDLHTLIPAHWRSDDLLMPGGISINEKGEVCLALQRLNLEGDVSSWGNPNTEIVILRCTSGGDLIESKLVSEADSLTANWLPNIERSVRPGELPNQPALMFTSGPPGGGLKDQMYNEVWAYLP